MLAEVIERHGEGKSLRIVIREKDEGRKAGSSLDPAVIPRNKTKKRLKRELEAYRGNRQKCQAKRERSSSDSKGKRWRKD